ncbi:MAG: hypothetical protein RLZZ127_638 [Planctomycetota bacterium]|jgi:prepilin-type N-terminal cleavage/methylation domain-containing protein
MRHTAPHRHAFTLIEILIACLLLGIGMTSVVGLVLRGIRTAQESSLWAMVVPSAHAAVDAAVGRGLLRQGDNAAIDLPSSAIPDFATPYLMRLDVVAEGAGSSMPGTVLDPDGTAVGASRLAGGTPGSLAWVRVRIYDAVEERDLGRPALATFHFRRLIRSIP